jgi:TorA maturation chaperone TorD
VVSGPEEAAGVSETPGAAAAARRSSAWWFLSRLIDEQPTEPWLSELEATLSTLESSPSTPLGPESAALLAALRLARAQQRGLTALAVDRTRLLAGVFQNRALPAPYESSAFGESMNSDRVQDLMRAYEGAGFENPAPELGPPDYLGTELRFMALLCYREMEAHGDADPGLAPAWLRHQQQFMDEHLLAWGPVHCDKLAAEAGTPFYAALGRLVACACRRGGEELGTLVAASPTAEVPEQAL